VARRPGDEVDDWFAGSPTHYIGISDIHESSYDLLDEAEWEAERKDRKDRLKKKRPCGFAPWPEDVHPATKESK
jgi:hypothetical protein